MLTRKAAIWCVLACCATLLSGCDTVMSNVNQLCVDLHWCDANTNQNHLPTGN